MPFSFLREKCDTYLAHLYVSFHAFTVRALTQAEEARAERKLDEVGELHARELKREREAWAAAEKIRREQWMAKVYDLCVCVCGS